VVEIVAEAMPRFVRLLLWWPRFRPSDHLESVALKFTDQLPGSQVLHQNL